MTDDRQSNALTGATAEAAAKLDEAVRAFNVYRGDPVALADDAIALAPDFTMAHLFKAWLNALATEPGAAAEAATVVARARRLRSNDREASHRDALDRLLGGDWTGSAIALDYHNQHHPHDLVALQVGHLLDFYRASSRSLRDRIARVLPQWSPSVPGYPIVLGMYAFGLEESGDYARAEENGRTALAMEPLDCWAHHAVAHVMEMQGRAEDGIGWMTTRQPYWSGDDNFFKVHNWWHLALYHLDLGRTDDVLRLYDGPVREDRSLMALDMVDASALLWRLTLAGADVGDRWQELASCWDRHADGRLYPFNDWHAVMAYLGAGRDGEVDRVRTALSTAIGERDHARWARTVGLPLVDGFTAFWRGDYRTAVDLLHRGRAIVNQFGGSHAQRDIIDWTLTEAAIRAGMTDAAMAFAAERTAVKPRSPVNLDLARRARGRGQASSLAA
jgi:hypothetical protein